MTSDYLVLTATVPAAQADLFVEICWELGTLGLEQEETGKGVGFKAYFDAGMRSSHLLQSFVSLGRRRGLDAPLARIDREEHRSEEWLLRWKESFTSFEAGPEIFIHPSWEPSSERHPVNILMEPGHAFGTGTHESTQLCLRALPGAAPAAGRFLDVGTGSGILSIAAARLRPRAVVFALDNDPLAVEMARENFQRNAVSAAGLLVGEASAVRGKFDFIMANLTLAILREQADPIGGLAGGTVLVSGFTAEQAPMVEERFRQAGPWHAIGRWDLGDWTCLLLGKRA